MNEDYVRSRDCTDRTDHCSVEEVEAEGSMMEVIIDRPPIYDKAAKVFPLQGREIFAWEDKIYNPGGFKIPTWLIAHEYIHSKQQMDDTGHWNAEAWWDRYLVDMEFRFQEELEAHQAEYREFCEHNRDRNKRLQYKRVVAKKLAAPLYGNMITAFDAMRKIK